MGGFMKCLLCLLRALFWDRRGGLNGGFYEVLVMFASCFVLGQEGGSEGGGEDEAAIAKDTEDNYTGKEEGFFVT